MAKQAVYRNEPMSRWADEQAPFSHHGHDVESAAFRVAPKVDKNVNAILADSVDYVLRRKPGYLDPCICTAHTFNVL